MGTSQTDHHWYAQVLSHTFILTCILFIYIQKCIFTKNYPQHIKVHRIFHFCTAFTLRLKRADLWHPWWSQWHHFQHVLPGVYGEVKLNWHMSKSKDLSPAQFLRYISPTNIRAFVHTSHLCSVVLRPNTTWDTVWCAAAPLPLLPPSPPSSPTSSSLTCWLCPFQSFGDFSCAGGCFDFMQSTEDKCCVTVLKRFTGDVRVKEALMPTRCPRSHACVWSCCSTVTLLRSFGVLPLHPSLWPLVYWSRSRTAGVSWPRCALWTHARLWRSSTAVWHVQCFFAPLQR